MAKIQVEGSATIKVVDHGRTEIKPLRGGCRVTVKPNA